MNPGILSAIIGATSGAVVAVVGWFVLHQLSLRREASSRRDGAARDHLEKQIEELYGPLLGLIQHSRLVFAVATRLLPTNTTGHLNTSAFSNDDTRVWRFFIDEYFLPVNAQIRQIVLSKMHLLSDGVLPKTFGAFLDHETRFEALHRLWKATGVDSSRIEGAGWPADFERDVQETLDLLRARHQLFLRRLGAAREHSRGAG